MVSLSCSFLSSSSIGATIFSFCVFPNSFSRIKSKNGRSSFFAGPGTFCAVSSCAGTFCAVSSCAARRAAFSAARRAAFSASVSAFTAVSDFNASAGTSVGADVF